MTAQSQTPTKAQTCTDHCSTCGQHFHGLGAFDRHLRRTAEGKNHWGAPEYDLEHVVGPPVGLQIWTVSGRCSLGSIDQEQVTIWQVIPTPGQVDWLRAQRPADASSGLQQPARGSETVPALSHPSGAASGLQTA